MSNLSFIPPATASKPTQDLQHTSLFEKKADFGPSSFEQFLQKADKIQYETKPFTEKQDQNRSVEKKFKSEPKKDESEKADLSSADKLESQSKPEAAVDGGAKEASQPQNEKEKVTTETEGNQDQESEALVDGNQDQLSALLAHLAQAEAVIRGETQPETVQMTEVAEAMAEPEMAEAVQGTAGVIESGATKLVEIGSETPVVNTADLKQVASNSGLKTENLQLNLEKSAEGKTEGLGDLSQIPTQVLGDHSRSEGESLSKEGQSDGKRQISESVKVVGNGNVKTEDESKAVNKLIFAEKALIKNTEANPEDSENRVLAQHDQSSAKTGKVNLAMIQTQLAVNDTPEAKTETPVLNVITSQPSFGNVSQTQVSGSEAVNSTNREELFSQIVEHAKVVVKNGGSEMEINLKPEHLGKLQLKVTIENDVVTAKFFAESQQVKEIIESNLSQLKRDLQENGMQVDTIMVSVGNHQGNEGFDQAAYNREQFNNSEGKVAGINDDAGLETQETTPPAQSDTLIDLIA